MAVKRRLTCLLFTQTTGHAARPADLAKPSQLHVDTVSMHIPLI